MMDRLRLVLPAILLATASLQAQGLYWESTSTGGPVPGGKPRTSKNYAAPKKFKIEQGNQVIIVRLDQEKMYMAEPASKTYSEMTFDDLEAAAEMMKQQMEMMKKQLENMPPEQRKAMEKQFGPMLRGKAAKVEVEKTAEKKDIAGRSAMKHVVKEDGKETLTLWVADDLKEFKALKGDFSDLLKRMSTMNPGMSNMAAASEKIEGFPLETDMKDMGKDTVTKVESRSVPDSEFEIPADYKKTASPLEALGGPGGPGGPRGKAKAKGKDKGEGAPAEKKKE